MSTTSKTKWVASIIVCGILLILSLMGGKWGTTYAANDIADDVPHIDFIAPDKILAGPSDKTIFISGSNFGNNSDTAVRVTGNGTDQILPGGLIYPNSIWVSISSSLLVNPITYNITVVVSYGEPPSIPTIPITPWDEESNPVPLTVIEGYHLYSPLIFK